MISHKLLKIKHDVEDFLEDEENILVLEDQPILTKDKKINENIDELISIKLKDQERTEQSQYLK